MSDGTDVYWLDGQARIWRVPVSGGTPVQMVSAAGDPVLSAITAIAVGSSDLANLSQGGVVMSTAR